MKAKKVLLCLVAAVALTAAVFGCTKVQTQKAEPEKNSGAKISVTVNIDGSAAEADGFKVGGSKETELTEGSSALDALNAAAKDMGFEVKCSGDYVTHIGDLGEKSCGPNSGWMYDVNGEMPNESAVKYIVKDGDTVTFTFWK